MASPLHCSHDLLLMVLFSAVALFATFDVTSARPGGLTTINNPWTNHQMQDLGRFAVREYNHHREKSSKPITFSAVTSARRQVVAGIQYYLKVEISVDGIHRVFIAVVHVKPDNSRKLVSFKPLLS